MKQAINNIIYDTDNAVLLATKAEIRWTTHLFKTKTGKYFKYVEFDHEGVSSTRTFKVLSVDEAQKLYNELSERFVDIRDAFPSVEFTDA